MIDLTVPPPASVFFVRAPRVCCRAGASSLRVLRTFALNISGHRPAEAHLRERGGGRESFYRFPLVAIGCWVAGSIALSQGRHDQDMTTPSSAAPKAEPFAALGKEGPSTHCIRAQRSWSGSPQVQSSHGRGKNISRSPPPLLQRAGSLNAGLGHCCMQW